MAIAMFSLPNLSDSLQALLGWLAPPRPVPASAAASRPLRPATPRMTAPAISTPRLAPLAKPLRVVRVLEPSASRAVAGRMVISGRMADVCAELDRLAAQEARGR